MGIFTRIVPGSDVPGIRGAMCTGERVKNKLPDLGVRLICIYGALPSSRQQRSDFLQFNSLCFVGEFLCFPTKISGTHIAQ